MLRGKGGGILNESDAERKLCLEMLRAQLIKPRQTEIGLTDSSFTGEQQQPRWLPPRSAGWLGGDARRFAWAEIAAELQLQQRRDWKM